jgi:tetratricopeptide (TPR) repeat protein
MLVYAENWTEGSKAPRVAPMTRRARASLALSSVLLALGLFAWRALAGHHVERLVASAEARLHAQLTLAPELTGLSASTAKSELASALDVAVPFAPPMREARGLLAYASAIEALQRADLPTAYARADRARALLGPTADVLVLSGTVARAALRHDEAVRDVQAALRIAPDHQRARLLDADLALDAGEGGHARILLASLVARLPEIGALHARLGRAYELEANLVAAERAYRTALSRDGRDPATFINLGRVLGIRGDLLGAKQAFDSALALAPNDPRAWLGHCMLALTAADAHATTTCTRAATLDRGAPEPVLALGDIARARGDLSEALHQYEAAASRAPSNAVAHTKRGHALFALGRLEEAASAYSQAITEAPGLSAAHNGLGVVLSFRGEHAAAREALERAARLDPRDAGPLLNLGMLAERTGDAADARSAFEAALERDPHNTAALERLLRL